MAQPALTPKVLRDADCWFAVDSVPDDELTTRWKRLARWRQAQWRGGHPVGTSPYRGGPKARTVGSRLDLEFARKNPVNLLTPAALAAARRRIANPEPHQMLNEDRLWADLLSSMPLCFNLFGDLDADPKLARSAVDRWWPDAPAGAVAVRFEHSPGRRDPLFLGNRSAFDVAFEIESSPETRAVIGVETKYHEHARVERRPTEERLRRYTQVTERSEAFAEGWQQALIGTDLQQIWLDHLLALSMRQHPGARWSWARFVLVFPAANPSFASAADRYRAVLRDGSTFEARTIESLLDGDGALPAETIRLLRERYL